MPAVLTQSLKHSGEFETELDTQNGKKMPIMVQFGPYTGLNRGKKMPTEQREDIKDTPADTYNPSTIGGGFFQVKATSNGRGGASAQIARGRAIGPGAVMRANYTVKQRSLNKIPALSGSRSCFFSIG